ncbi:MAG: hypothetical protein ACTIKL_07875 [Canibacter sp.]
MNSSPHATTTGEQPTLERRNRHRGRWIAAGTVAALVIAAGAVGIPLLVKQHHMKEYQNVSAEISQQYEKQAADSDKLTATNEVLTLHRAAAGDVAEQVTNLGKAKDPVIKKATAKKLAEAGKQLTAALAEANDDAEAAAAVEPLLTAEQVKEVTGYPMDFTVKDAATVLGLNTKPQKVKKVGEANITQQVVEDARKELAQQKKVTKAASAELQAATHELESLNTTVSDSVNVSLRAAAKDAPAQAKAVVKATSKASKKQLSAVTDSAKKAADNVADGTTSELAALVSAYVKASNTATSAHAKVVKAEKQAAADAAAAAASEAAPEWEDTGGGDYYDDGYSDDWSSEYSGGDYATGGSSGGGTSSGSSGGSSGGTSGGGSSGGGGSSNDGGSGGSSAPTNPCPEGQTWDGEMCWWYDE